MKLYTLLLEQFNPVSRHLANPIASRFNCKAVLLLAVATVGALVSGKAYAHGDAEALEEIVITSTRTHRSFSQQPTRVEVLGAEELNEKANMKPGDIRMLLNESTGIYVQQTSATSFNSSIRIQGLDGKYTQLLRDSLPLYGGFSGGLSLLQIAPLDLAQVELLKGANSTLYGGGAIAGLVNLVSKTPEDEPERSILVNATSANGLDLSGFFSGRRGAYGANLFTSYNRGEAYDPADNGFSAIPKFERWTLNPTLFIEGKNRKLKIGLNAITEDRLGGDINYVDGRRDTPAYFEDSPTTRLATHIEYTQRLASGQEVVFRNSISHFERQLRVPDFVFAGTQLSSFSELHILGEADNLDWVAGINLWTEDFEQKQVLPSQALDYSNNTVGVFAQGTRGFADNLTLEGGLRVDHHSQYGTFVLPRLSLLYTPSSKTTLRIGGGLGYKEPTIFTEESERLQFRGLLPLQQDELEAERSSGINLDINRAFELSNSLDLNLNWLLFYTRVDDPLNIVEQAPVQPAPGEQAQSQFAYQQVNDYVDSRGTEINAVFKWSYMKLFLGYTHADVQEHGEGGKNAATLVPQDRVNTVLVYEREDDLRIGLEAYYYGSQTLNDGTQSRDYWIFGLMAEKIFGDDFSVFLNFENFTDTRQTRYESINSGSVVNPIFNDIYAPLDGFVINGGFKLSF